MSAHHAMRRLSLAAFVVAIMTVTGCQSSTPGTPIRTADFVDLQQFSGLWYVIATIPTPFERDVFNATEYYAAPEGNRIATTFSFNKGALDGPEKSYNPTGFVTDDPSNAVWGMQFVWPFKAEYRVVHVDDDYGYTVIGRSKRDYVWIMSRNPSLPAETYDELVSMIADEGYDTSKLVRIAHSS